MEEIQQKGETHLSELEWFQREVLRLQDRNFERSVEIIRLKTELATVREATIRECAEIAQGQWEQLVFSDGMAVTNSYAIALNDVRLYILELLEK